MRGNIKRYKNRYQKFSLWAYACILLLSLLIMQVEHCVDLAMCVLIPVVFFLISTYVFVECWCAVLTRHSAGKFKFYLLGSVTKMLVAAVVFLIAELAMDTKPQKLTLAVYFGVCFICSLVIDSFIFSQYEKQCSKEKNEYEAV